MAACSFIFALLCLAVVNSEYVNRKFCQNVDQSTCSIHGVRLDPCPDGPGFCVVRRLKPYRLGFDYTPRFEADKMMLSLMSDNDSSGEFNSAIIPPQDACDYQACPTEAGVRTTSEIDFVYEEKVYDKFPIQLKLWNVHNQTEACCFTFNVKILK